MKSIIAIAAALAFSSIALAQAPAKAPEAAKTTAAAPATPATPAKTAEATKATAATPATPAAPAKAKASKKDHDNKGKNDAKGTDKKGDSKK